MQPPPPAPSAPSTPSGQPPRRGAEPGTLRLGQIAGVDITVRASWLLIAALISVMLAPKFASIAPGLGPLVYLAGLAFAVLLYLSVLLHELSHALTAKAFGLPVRSVNLHFLGGFTEIDGEPDTPRREFLISIVGPLTSIAVGLVALGVHQLVPETSVLGFVIGGLAAANLVVGVLNLVPGLPLDGGRVLRAFVWRVSGRPQLATQVAGWAGRVVAVLALVSPFASRPITGEDPDFSDYVLAFVVGAFLWSGASQALVAAKVRRRLPGLRARSLARRALAVPHDLPLGEAVRRAQEAEAGGVVVLASNGEPIGIVNEAAVNSTPPARRPWITAGAVARRIEPGLLLPVDLEGEPLVRAMQRTPAAEYVVVDQDGGVFGVLATADVDAAFAQG